MIRLRTLGTLDLRNSDGSEIRSVLAQPRRLSPLLYLAIATPRGFHRRDRLVALFWPDQGADRARASLSRAVHFLRRELGDDVLLSRGDEIGINLDRFWSDAADFEDAIATQRWRNAVDLYRGDLLPGFFLSGAVGFEQWLESERARLRELAARAAWTVADEEEKAGNLLQAAQNARRGVELSPFQEINLRRLLALLDRVGDRAGAGHAYQQFEQHIAAELELSPSPETRALIGAIRRRDQVNGFPDSAVHNPSVKGSGNGEEPSRAVSSLGSVAQPPRRHRRRIAVAAAVVAIGAAAGAWLGRTSVDPSRVYVASFETSGDARLDRIGRLARDGIVQSLTMTGLVEVEASGENDTTIRRVSSPAPSRRTQHGRRRAGTLVAGALYPEGERIRVQASITDVQHSRVVWVVRPMSASADSIDDAIDELGGRVAGAVAALMTPRFASWFPLATSPPKLDAFQPFAHGVDLQQRGFDRDAVEHLSRAVAIDTSFTWARMQLALAYLNLFEQAAADSIIAELNDGREALLPLQRHWLDWMLSFRTEDVPGGYRAIRAAAELAPERFLHTQAQWAYKLNRPRETISVLTRLGPNSVYTGGNDAYWDLLTSAHHALGDGEQELTAAREARRHPVDPMNALTFELRALARLGSIPEVRALLDTALTLAKEREPAPRQLMVGIARWASPALVMVATARELRAHGHEGMAMETLARALAWYRSQPVNGSMTEARRFELGHALYLSRDWAGAEEVFQELAAEDSSNFIYTGFLGTIAARLGDSVAARQIIARFDTLRSTLLRPHAEAGYWQGKISALLGDEERAIECWKESAGQQGRSGPVHADFDFERMWRTKAFLDFIRPKG
jgi:DNA-binding SARP family transcriptional activator/tetratricopeptide (TPR) repeat protein